MSTSQRSLACTLIVGFATLYFAFSPTGLSAQRISGGSVSKPSSRVDTQSSNESTTRSKPEREEQSRSSSYSEPAPVYTEPAHTPPKSWQEEKPVSQPSTTTTSSSYDEPSYDTYEAPKRSEKPAKKKMGGFSEVSGQEKGPSLQIKNIQTAESQVNQLIVNPRWNDSLFIHEVKGWMDEVHTQIQALTGDDRAIHQQWYDDQMQALEFFIAWEADRRLLLDFFRLKALFLPDINPEFPKSVSNREKRDLTFALPEGGWDYLTLVNSWNPNEIFTMLNMDFSLDPAISLDFSFVQLQQFFSGYQESNLKKHLDQAIDEQIKLSNSLASTDPEKSTFILENAYFLLRAGELLTGGDSYYAEQVAYLNNQYPGLPALVGENLPAVVPFFPHSIVPDEGFDRYYSK